MRLASATSAKHPLFDSQSDRELTFGYAILLNIRALEPALSTAGQYLESLIQRFDQPTEISCYTSAMVRETKNKQKYFFCLKVCQRWCDGRETRKISEMSWRYGKCGEFGIQQVKQSARVVVFAEVTTTR